MTSATSRRALQPTATFILTLTLASLLPLVGLGQADQTKQEESVAEQVAELVADLQRREADLEEMRLKIAKDPDNAAAKILEKELSERREKYRRDSSKLVELVLSGEDAGADMATGRTAAIEILEKEAQSMLEKSRQRDQKIVELMNVIEDGSGEEAQMARAKMIDSIPPSDRLISYIDTNLHEREQLGLDVQAESANLVKRLETRADIVSGLLRNTKSEVEAITRRPGADQDAEAQKQLAELKRQRDTLAESQRNNVRILSERGVDTAMLRQEIITATGKLSEDILDKDVAAGLIERWLTNTAEWLRSNGASLVFQVLVFFLILFGFWILARIARGAVCRGIERSKLNISSLAKDFFIKMASRMVMLVGMIIAIAQIGIEVGPLLAGLGIAGFVVGFALQDTLSNFASGMMILVYRPFDVGDAIEAGGVTGKVDQMNLVATMVLTFDNQLLIVPNKQIWGGVIRNITHQATRRVDLTFGIGYSDDIPKAEKVLAEIVAGHEKVLKDPEPVIRLHELGDSSVNFVVRPWSKTSDYWDVYWDVTREVKRRFDEQGISIPFPQRDVHIYREDGGDTKEA
jgi:small conductance mechanosensitive channel